MSLIIPNSFGSKTTAQLGDIDENFSYLKTNLDPYVNAITINGTDSNFASNATINGNLTLIGTSRKIIGDFSNATVSNRVAFQTSQTDSATRISVVPSGTATQGALDCYSSSAMNNCTIAEFTSLPTETRINSSKVGTATSAPITFMIDSQEKLRIGTDNIISVPTGVKVNGTDVGSIYAPGMIIQTVYKRVDTKAVVSFAAAGSVGSFITDLDTTFTPKFSNSLIHIQMCLTYEVQHDTVFRLYRDSNVIGLNVNDANYWSGTWLPGYDADNSTTARTNHFFYMDTPNTTSAVTYRLMIQSAGVAASTFYLNRTISSAGAANNEVAISQIIIQEIKQ